MSKNRTIPILIILLLWISQPIQASQIQVEALIKENRLEVGQSTTLTLKIQGSSGVAAPEVELSDWQVQYYGPSTQISIVNGRREESVSHLYSVAPLKAGQVQIPPIQVRVKGQTYQTQPITVQVAERGQGQSQSLTQQLKDYVFLEVELDRETVYLNEEIPMRVKLYFHQDIQLHNIHYPELGLGSNFLGSQMGEPQQTYESRNGQYFNVLPFDVTIQPITKGEYTIQPQLTTDIALPRKSQSRDPFDTFFGSNYDLYTLNMEAPKTTVQVKDFPAEGRPADFKGTVGRFQMEVTVMPQQVQPGEPVTIRTRFTGNGNYNTLSAPVLEQDSNFKYYDPQLVTKQEPSNQQGRQQSSQPQEKVYEQVVIPNQPVDTLPTINFSYFDPVAEIYRTIRRSDLEIQVSGGGGSATARQVVDYRQTQETQAVLGRDVLYIKATPGHMKPLDQGLFTLGTVAYPAGMLFMLFLGAGLKWKLGQESPVQRKRKVVTAETRLLLTESAKMLQTGQDKAEFYNTVYQAVQNYLKEYFQINITGISDYENGLLVKAGVAEETLEKIDHFYRKMDEMRYAGAFSSEADMRQVLELAQEIVTEIAEGEVA